MTEPIPQESALVKTFNAIVKNAVADNQGAKTLETLAGGALENVSRSSETPEAIAAAMKLAAESRMANEKSPMEPKEK